MPYTTVQQVRDESGFQSNSNVTDSHIQEYQTRAYHIVNGYVGRRYKLSTLSGALFVGSQAEQILEQAELLLASGRLLLEQYQGQPMGEANGKQKIEDAQKILDDIAAGNLRLLDVNGDEFTGDSISGAGISIAYTAPPRLDADPTSSERKFSVDTKF